MSTSNVSITDPTSGKRAVVGDEGAMHMFVGNPNSVPPRQFTIPPQQASIAPGGSPTQSPDPQGTHYLITSFTVSNSSGSVATLHIEAISATYFAGGCYSIANAVHEVKGPMLVVGPNSTQTITFPQPYIIGAAGGLECLAVGGSGFAGMMWSVVGYKR